LKNLKEQKDKIEALREELEEITRGDGSNFTSSKRYSALTDAGKLSMMNIQGNPFEPEQDASTVMNSNEYQQLLKKLERL
jgi:peroxiredoxin